MSPSHNLQSTEPGIMSQSHTPKPQTGLCSYKNSQLYPPEEESIAAGEGTWKAALHPPQQQMLRREEQQNSERAEGTEVPLSHPQDSHKNLTSPSHNTFPHQHTPTFHHRLHPSYHKSESVEPHSSGSSVRKPVQNDTNSESGGMFKEEHLSPEKSADCLNDVGEQQKLFRSPLSRKNLSLSPKEIEDNKSPGNCMENNQWTGYNQSHASVSPKPGYNNSTYETFGTEDVSDMRAFAEEKSEFTVSASRFKSHLQHSVLQQEVKPTASHKSNMVPLESFMNHNVYAGQRMTSDLLLYRKEEQNINTKMEIKERYLPDQTRDNCSGATLEESSQNVKSRDKRKHLHAQPLGQYSQSFPLSPVKDLQNSLQKSYEELKSVSEVFRQGTDLTKMPRSEDSLSVRKTNRKNLNDSSLPCSPVANSIPDTEFPCRQHGMLSSQKPFCDRDSKTDSSNITEEREISCDEGKDESTSSHKPNSPSPIRTLSSDPTTPNSLKTSKASPVVSTSMSRAQYRSLQRPNIVPHDQMFAYHTLSRMTPQISLEGLVNPVRHPYMPHTSSILSQVGQTAEEKDVFFCHLCTYSGKSKVEFDAHMNTHFDFNCPHCDYTSRTEGRLKRHIKDFHSENSSKRVIPGRPKVYKCKQCPFSNTEKDKFWKHSRTHIKEDKLLQCPKCPFVTEYKHHLEYHLYNHFGSKPFKCSKCNYSCVNKSMLNSHMKSHTNVYQYRCSNCTYATKYCHSLKLHLKKYGHKPATVLNQDGSLPQGLDAETCGLSSLTKYGPHHGPRLPKKDKDDLHHNQFFGMSQALMGFPAMNPVLSGLMPFWPVFPREGIQNHPEKLPRISNREQQVKVQAEHYDVSDISEDSSERSRSMTDEDLTCGLCSFTAKNTEILYLHGEHFHKQQVKEETISHVTGDTKIEKNFSTEVKHECKSPGQSELAGIGGPHEDKQVSSADGQLMKQDSDFLEVPIIRQKESASVSSFSECAFPCNYSNKTRLPDMYSTSINSANDEENDYSPTSGMGILQQITLKLGGDVFSDINLPSYGKEFHIKEKMNQTTETFKYSSSACSGQMPLDLTKQRPSSSSFPSVSNFCIEEDSNDERKTSVSDHEGRSPSKVAELLHTKRPVSDVGVIISGKSASTAEASQAVPRKRARKGKAFKLDIRRNLQKKLADSSQENKDQDSDIGISSNSFRSFQATEKDEKEDRTKVKINSDFSYLEKSNHDIRSVNNTAEKNQRNDKNDNSVKGDAETNRTVEIKQETEEDESNKTNENDTDTDTDQNPEKDRFCLDGPENELQKLQRRLGFQSKGSESDSEKNCASDADKPHEKSVDNIPLSSNITQNFACKISLHEQKLSNKDDSTDIRALSTQIHQKILSEGHKKQAATEHTVLENWEKPLPSATGEDTEPAWKHVNDDHANVVTSLPAALRSTDPSQDSLRETTSSDKFLAIRSGLIAPALLPYYSHSHIPQLHHPSAQQPLTSMKTSMTFSIPPIPKAYIFPTNRMMPELETAVPTSSSKLLQQELFECIYCELSFRDCIMYTVHMGYHSSHNPFQCSSCGAVSRDKVEFFLHIARSPHV